MKKLGLRAVIAVCLVFTFCMSASAEEIKVGGGGAACNTILRPVKPHFEKATGITLSVMQSTPKNGLISLLGGGLDAAVAAVSLEGMISGAEKDGVKVDAAALQKFVVGKNKTVIFLHKDNPVKTLSKEQVKGIFTGKITNWKAVGGKDMPIIVVWGKASPGQNAQLIKMMLDGEAVTKDVLDATDYANIKENVVTTPEAIGIDPIGLADASVSVPETPEMSSPVILVTKGAPSPNVQKLLDFLKGEGQKHVKQ